MAEAQRRLAAEVLEMIEPYVKPGLAANQRLQDSRDGNQQIGGAGLRPRARRDVAQSSLHRR